MSGETEEQARERREQYKLHTIWTNQMRPKKIYCATKTQSEDKVKTTQRLKTK